MIKTIYFFGTSHTAGGGFEFDSKLKSFRFDDTGVNENDKPRGELLKEIYSNLYPNEIQTQENFSFVGQFKKLLNEKNINIEVVNISKQGYGNDRIYRKFYDLIKTDSFKKDESVFIFEMSDIERKELFYKPVNDHIVINYGALNRNKLTNEADMRNFREPELIPFTYGKTYWYETDEDVNILKADKKFFKNYVEKTINVENEIHVLNYNNINFFSFLKLNNFNFLISEMHNILYDELRPYYDFIHDHFISFTCYKNKKYKGFLHLINKNQLLIPKECNFKYTDRHSSFLGNKIIAKNIFNECVSREIIESSLIKIEKKDFIFPNNKNKSIF